MFGSNETSLSGNWRYPRADPGRHSPGGKAAGDAAADFAGTAEHEYGRLLFHGLCHVASQAHRNATDNDP
jgi:hypothetical protein